MGGNCKEICRHDTDQSFCLGKKLDPQISYQLGSYVLAQRKTFVFVMPHELVKLHR
jgi:hypothetical protein